MQKTEAIGPGTTEAYFCGNGSEGSPDQSPVYLHYNQLIT